VRVPVDPPDRIFVSSREPRRQTQHHLHFLRSQHFRHLIIMWQVCRQSRPGDSGQCCKRERRLTRVGVYLCPSPARVHLSAHREVRQGKHQHGALPVAPVLGFLKRALFDLAFVHGHLLSLRGGRSISASLWACAADGTKDAVGVALTSLPGPRQAERLVCQLPTGVARMRSEVLTAECKVR
jgi:hypothetical protein